MNVGKAVREVFIDVLCCAVLFGGYEAFFDHYRLLSQWSGVDVAAGVDAAGQTAKSLLERERPTVPVSVQSTTPLPSPGSPQTPAGERQSAPTAAKEVPAPQIAVGPNVPHISSPPKIESPAARPVYKRTHKPQPLKFEKRKTNGVPYYIATVDLNDPEFYVEIALPHDVTEANTLQCTHGDESFEGILKRHPAAFAINGTFFAKNDQKSVMGNMVSGGRMLKYSQWEDYGTTLGLQCRNQPEMTTASWQGKPNWFEHWFSLTCGPRLVENGEVKVDPESEGFSDDHVLGIGPRSAIGFPASKDKLYVVSFLRGLSLPEEAKLMQAIGCSDAMNLDGGASKAVAYNGKVIMKPGRNLTNVLLFYDCKHPAPKKLVASWNEFQARHERTPAITTAQR